MSVLKVINVGQGDSLILLPEEGCTHSGRNVFVDLGDGRRDALAESEKERETVVALSHAHKDHIGGLAWLAGHQDRLAELWLPLYYEEILVITDLILRLRENRRLTGDFGPVVAARHALSAARLLYTLSESLKVPVSGVYEGLSMCKHIRVLNPPITAETALDCEADDISKYIETLRSTDFAELRQWFSDADFSRLRNTVLTEGWSYDVPSLLGGETPNTFENKQRFLFGLLMTCRETINAYLDAPTPARFTRVFKKVKETSNNCSAVFEYMHRDFSVFFTGDVGKKVLMRLARNRMLREIDVLKVPHHGSKHNLSAKVLKTTKPKLAIVCHNNGRYGRQLDPHPNKEIIQLLDRYVNATYYANAVIKDEAEVKPQAHGFTLNNRIEFIR